MNPGIIHAELIAGVLLSAGTVAVLARCLQRAGESELANEIAFAIDGDWTELTLAPSEEDEILTVLYNCPLVLQP